MKTIKNMSVEEIIIRTNYSELKADIIKLRECFAILIGVVSILGITIFVILWGLLWGMGQT